MTPEVPILQLPQVDREDVEQEAALLRLQGITPNKAILAKRLQPHELTFSGDLEEALPLISPRIIPSTDTIEAIVDWALTQSSSVQSTIWDFFQDPEDRIDATLKALHLQETYINKKIPMTKLLLQALPCTKEALVEVVVQASPNTKRPEASVRQFLRRYNPVLLNGVYQEVTNV